ncbi:MAG: hypothetical protein ABIN89_20185 [Chitinophagaceae bacterium]
MYFIHELKRRNPVLFWYGGLNFIAAIICIVLLQTTRVEVNGINAFFKPLKFYLSIAIFVWTMGWILYYLEMPSKVKSFNIMTVLVLTYEIFVITWQAANGRLSHFNENTPLYGILFMLMGVAISLLTIWTGYLCYLFFKKKNWTLPMSYVWGIRLGILLFVVFAFEGGVMAAINKHTIGAADGGKGLLFVNWSRQNGDLRIAHFLGMHTLQLFPLFGYYITRSSHTMKAFAIIYLMIVVAILTQALMGSPLV